MRLLLFLSIVLFTSCVTQKRCAEKYPPEVSVKDSIIEKEVITYRDTTIIIPGDTVQIIDTIPCPGIVYKKKATSKSGHTTIDVSIDNGKLKVDCKTDSLQQVIDSLATIFKDRQHFKTTTVTYPVPVEIVKYKTPKWAWYLLAFNVVFFGWKYRGFIVGGASKLLNIIKKVV